MIRIIQVSDTHLSPSVPGGLSGWRTAVAHIRKVRPALVIHTGDIVRDEPSVAEDRDFAAAELASLGVEVLALPGNHDVGDGPPVTRVRSPGLLHDFSRSYGSPFWSRAVGSWRLIGVNGMLFGFGGDEEAEQWTWLHGELARRPHGGNFAVFLHKPPFLIAPDEPGEMSSTIPFDSKIRFWDLMKDAQIRLVACGHRHEYRSMSRDGIQVVWAPTTSGLFNEETPPFEPGAQPGLLDYVFSGSTVIHRFVPTDGEAHLA